MECPNCGQENRDVARFCQRCGASLVSVEPAAGAMTPEAAPEETPGTAEAAPVPLDESAPLPEKAEQVPDEDHAADEPAILLAEDEPVPDAKPLPVHPEAASERVEAVEPEVEEALDDVPETPTPEHETDSTDVQEKREPQPNISEPSKPAPSAPEVPGPATDSGFNESKGLEPVHEAEAVDAEQQPDQPSVAYPLIQAQELADAHLLPGSNEPASREALELGTVLHGRYQVIEVMEGPGIEQPTQIRYRVRDLQRCPQCGAEGHSPDEAFCPVCGALMDQKPVAFLLEQPAAIEDVPEAIEPDDQFTQGEQSYWVWRENVEEEAVKEEKPLMRLLVGLQSDTGQVRELDEDSMFVLTMAATYESVTHQLGLFIVADGMGGHEGGEVASRLAIQTAAESLIHDLFVPELAGHALSTSEILYRLNAAIRQANDEVYLERQKRENDMGTTLTAAFVKDWSLHLGHVGDCRAYRWGEGGLQQLTTDHSIVAGMVAAGTIQPEEIYTHPQRSVIYRCIGDQPTVEVDVDNMQLLPGERLLVCCDGLWEMLHNEGIEDILLAEADPQTACDVMVHQANLAGGSDNISVIIVQL